MAYMPACSCCLRMIPTACPGSDHITQEKNCLISQPGHIIYSTANPRVFTTGGLIWILTNRNTWDSRKPAGGRTSATQEPKSGSLSLYKPGNICTMWPQPQMPGWDGRKFNTRVENLSCLFFFFFRTRVLHLCWITQSFGEAGGL